MARDWATQATCRLRMNSGVAQHTKTVGWVPGADEVAAMERKVCGDVAIVVGRGGVLSGPTVQGRGGPSVVRR